MTNLILIFGIFLCFAYAVYDQFIMDKLKGKTLLNIELKRQVGIDIWISVGLIVLTIAQGISQGIGQFTFFLLVICIILCIYLAFFRSPRLLLKQAGFFFGNFFFEYRKIKQINLAEQQILVIDLHNGKRLLVRIKQAKDVEQVVNFFGGYR